MPAQLTSLHEHIHFDFGSETSSNNSSGVGHTHASSSTFGIQDGDTFESLEAFKSAVFREAIKQGWTPRTIASRSVETAKLRNQQAFIRLSCQPFIKKHLCPYTVHGSVTDGIVYAVVASSELSPHLSPRRTTEIFGTHPCMHMSRSMKTEKNFYSENGATIQSNARLERQHTSSEMTTRSAPKSPLQQSASSHAWTDMPMSPLQKPKDLLQRGRPVSLRRRPETTKVKRSGFAFCDRTLPPCPASTRRYSPGNLTGRLSQ